jgi:HD-GYP domain-containing protein (c-di-GMP phosphodiesterase class II)
MPLRGNPPYRLEATMSYIRDRAGSQFDPHVATALVTLVEEQRLPFKL